MKFHLTFSHVKPSNTDACTRKQVPGNKVRSEAVQGILISFPNISFHIVNEPTLIYSMPLLQYIIK